MAILLTVVYQFYVHQIKTPVIFCTEIEKSILAVLEVTWNEAGLKFLEILLFVLSRAGVRDECHHTQP